MSVHVETTGLCRGASALHARRPGTAAPPPAAEYCFPGYGEKSRHFLSQSGRREHSCLHESPDLCSFLGTLFTGTIPRASGDSRLRIARLACIPGGIVTLDCHRIEGHRQRSHPRRPSEGAIIQDIPPALKFEHSPSFREISL